MPEIGRPGQAQLADAKVLVIGAGGLGCPVLIYLVSSGIGTVGIIDDDLVSLTNIHRQILYNEEDVNKYKVDIAYEKLAKINPVTKIVKYKKRLTEANSESVIKGYDIIIDGSDNSATRRILDNSCFEFGKPWIYAAVSGFEGRVSVFNLEKGFRYSDLYPAENEITLPADCSVAGILGSTCAYAASIQVAEAVKIILEKSSVLEGKILTFNLYNHLYRLISINKADSEKQHE